MPTRRNSTKSKNTDKFVESVKQLMEQPYNISRQMLRETNIEAEAVIQPGEQTARPTPPRFLLRSTIDRMFEKGTATLNIKRDVVRVLRKLLPDLAWHDNPDVCVRWLNGGEIPSSLDKEGPIRKMRKELETRIVAARDPEAMMAAILAFSVDDEKLRFWNVINRLATELNLQDFQSQLSRAGMPPGIPVREGEWTLDVAGRILKGGESLTGAQRVVWSLAVKAYPPRPNGGAYPGLKDAARWLAKYWEYGVLQAAKAKYSKEGWIWNWDEVAPKFAGRKLEVWLLSWLELPLVKQTKDENIGKFHMFQLGLWLEANRRRSPPA